MQSSGCHRPPHNTVLKHCRCLFHRGRQENSAPSFHVGQKAGVHHVGHGHEAKARWRSEDTALNHRGGPIELTIRLGRPSHQPPPYPPAFYTFSAWARLLLSLPASAEGVLRGAVPPMPPASAREPRQNWHNWSDQSSMSLNRKMWLFIRNSMAKQTT